MKYDLSKDESAMVEAYRNLLPEFQGNALKHLESLFDLQTKIFKELLNNDRKVDE